MWRTLNPASLRQCEIDGVAFQVQPITNGQRLELERLRGESLKITADVGENGESTPKLVVVNGKAFDVWLDAIESYIHGIDGGSVQEVGFLAKLASLETQLKIAAEVMRGLDEDQQKN